MTDTHPVPFSLEELWVLQGTIRHEQAQPWQGSWPAYNLDLNGKIARAILFCIDYEQEFAQVVLTKGDTLAIDYCVSKDIKDANGKPVGKKILEKVFRARLAIEDGNELVVDEPDDDGRITRLSVFRKANE